jgi:hypothetical protein
LQACCALLLLLLLLLLLGCLVRGNAEAEGWWDDWM